MDGEEGRWGPGASTPGPLEMLVLPGRAAAVGAEGEEAGDAAAVVGSAGTRTAARN